MNLEYLLSQKISLALASLFNIDVKPESIGFQKTNKEFDGDITLVVFPFVKASGKSPEETGRLIGNYLKENTPEITGFNTVKGFLNLVIGNPFWLDFFAFASSKSNFGISPAGSSDRTIMVEYSSPNTNKPLHLGHIRNNLLGYSVARILEANGNTVIKTNLVNDRGIHICKSMLAWTKWGNGETPESANLKGDHLVGKYYVEFDKHYKAEVKALETAGKTKEEAEKQAPLMLEIQKMLLLWEAGDPETISLWKMMNSWVYAGFDITYKTLGVEFDRMYYESDTYLLGKKIVEEGLTKNIFYKKEDGSVWIDLTGDKLDHKVLLRADGTSVYMTQDLGTAAERFREYPKLSQLIYTVGNEQDYHFRVLFLILGKMGYPQAKSCYHLSYGMVELPEGKMKSREGTVVDADDLITEMIGTAKSMTLELGKADSFSEVEAEELYKEIGLAALKYFILKVDPKKKMVFDPKESIDFVGNTGPFIQYTHARINSLLRKGKKEMGIDTFSSSMGAEHLLPIEKELLKIIYRFPEALKSSAAEYNPAVVANYAYELSKEYSTYFQTVNVLKEENRDLVLFRLALSDLTGQVIRNAMSLLGISVPERM
jgi:arginyl-tRNA synthetase